MITMFKFEYVKHHTVPLKDTFKSTKIEVSHCGDKYVSADGLNTIALNDVGKLIDGTTMFLTENDPRKFIEAIVRKTEDNISFHKKYIDDMIQRKTKWEYWLLDHKE